MAVVGVGGVGSVTAEMLTRCGIGKVTSWFSPSYFVLFGNVWFYWISELLVAIARIKIFFFFVLYYI